MEWNAKANKNEAVSYCVVYMENKFTEYAWIYAGRIINFTSYNMRRKGKIRIKTGGEWKFFLSSSSVPRAPFFHRMKPPISSHSDKWKYSMNIPSLLYNHGWQNDCETEKIAIWGAQTSLIFINGDGWFKKNSIRI